MNAWYGLGVVYHRQERLGLAEHHFRRGLALSPHSSVLACYLGMVLHASGDAAKREEALAVLRAAADTDALNPQLHFQLAHVYLAEEALSEAFDALLTVRELAPREPSVHSLLGQVSHRLGRGAEAVAHFNTAVALDPKVRGLCHH